MKTLTVELAERSYPIFIGSGLLDKVDCYRSCIRGNQVFIVTNETVAPLYLERLERTLAALPVDVARVILPDGEQYKTLATLETVFDGLLHEHHNRTTTLIALGGGVVGDMTGFAAACYQRGVHFIQIPTTLLAQVDSSVGGKTAVNHPLGKNMIGAFHQPVSVIADTDVLSSLPERELRAGLAEVIKYGLIADEPFLGWLEANCDRLLARDNEALAYAIEVSCRTKADVVSRDETEQGMRAILNLGHTFGHAIETEQGYGEWLHGEAVAAGMLLACQLSAAMGWLSEIDVDRVADLLQRCGLPLAAPPHMTADVFLRHMALDKKVTNGKIRLVLLRALGEAVVTDEYDSEALEALLSG